MSVQVVRGYLQYVEGLVRPFRKPVAGEGRTVMKAARGVEPPVFGDAEGGVVVPLPGVILLAGAFGCYFQHEVRGLPWSRME